MIERGCVEDLHTRANRATLRFVCAINQAGNACLNQRARAHGAWLDRHIDRCADESMIAGLTRGLAQSDDFRMRGRVTIGDGAIARGGENAFFQHNQGPHWYLPAERGRLRLNDCHMHVFKIDHGCRCVEAGIKDSTSITSCSPSFRRVWEELRATPRHPLAPHELKASWCFISTRPMSFR